ncbi:hypothetical protein V1477_011770 [Vespula maculifrons]|uniref:Uncharacterized protein n=1 Tax=Vespula maculifrons TaxID=7453 RepID=A0ABD2C065_VESMC
MGVGFCAGLLSVPNNRAGFSYSGFALVCLFFSFLFHVHLSFQISSVSHMHISIHRIRSYVSSKGSFHNPLLDAHTGKIERTLSRVSAGTSVVFSGAIKSPTVKDFV